MVPLDDQRWSDLQNAYGSSRQIPELLRQLKSHPPDDEPEAEPYFSLWSALCHQGDVYTASYAALPHIVAAIELAPAKAQWTLFLMIACIEIARSKGRGPEIPADCKMAYVESLGKVPQLVGSAASTTWDHWYCGAALASIAAAKGFHEMAEAVLELNPQTIKEMLDG